MTLDRFYVITPYFNPQRYESRKRLYLEFKERMRRAGVKLVTVELALSDRQFEVEDNSDPLWVGLRSEYEIWQKEAMINYVARHFLPKVDDRYEYLCWVDGDIEFNNPNWAEETWHALQHNLIVQMFQNAIDLGPDGQVLQVHNGFCYSALQGLPYVGPAYTHWHPGFAWAMHRDTFEQMTRLLDVGICGASDHHMALALIGRAEDSVPSFMHPAYKDSVMNWQKRASWFIRKDFGYVPGTILHSYHGKKKDRKYWDRWQIIRGDKFNPTTDVYRDVNELWAISEFAPRLRDELRAYFKQRNEDSIDL